MMEVVAMLCLPVHPDDLVFLPNLGHAQRCATAAEQHVGWLKEHPVHRHDCEWECDACYRAYLWRELATLQEWRWKLSHGKPNVLPPTTWEAFERKLVEFRWALGPRSYYRGQMPLAIPVYRFPECEPGEGGRKDIVFIFR
jgi:hypothetical protein